jgi:hypothetical protein
MEITNRFWGSNAVTHQEIILISSDNLEVIISLYIRSFLPSLCLQLGLFLIPAFIAQSENQSVPPDLDQNPDRPQASNLPGNTSPFGSRSGEFLEYEVYWTELLVGRINVINHGLIERANRSCLKLEAYARTVGVVESLYAAKMKFIGYLLPDYSSWLYEEWEKEDSWRLQDWLEFLPHQSKVRRFKKGKLRSEIAIPSNTYDPATASHYLLTRPLVPGDHYELTVTDGKDLYHAIADVTSGPVSDSFLGKLKTVEVAPQLFFQGKPLGKRAYKIVFTADERRIPVRIWVDVEFGSFTAVLIKYRHPSLNPMQEPILSSNN